MIVCGLIFILLAVLLKISVLTTIGFIVMIIGFVVLSFNVFGYAVGGPRYWY
jgi:hypothetical protein